MPARVFPVSFYQFLSVFMLSRINAENPAALKTKKNATGNSHDVSISFEVFKLFEVFILSVWTLKSVVFDPLNEDG